MVATAGAKVEADGGPTVVIGLAGVRIGVGVEVGIVVIVRLIDRPNTTLTDPFPMVVLVDPALAGPRRVR
jgi:hypothetical protein